MVVMIYNYGDHQDGGDIQMENYNQLLTWISPHFDDNLNTTRAWPVNCKTWWEMEEKMSTLGVSTSASIVLRWVSFITSIHFHLFIAMKRFYQQCINAIHRVRVCWWQWKMWPCLLVQPGEIELVLSTCCCWTLCWKCKYCFLAPPRPLSQVMFFVPWAPRRTWHTAASGLMPGNYNCRHWGIFLSHFLCISKHHVIPVSGLG